MVKQVFRSSIFLLPPVAFNESDRVNDIHLMNAKKLSAKGG